MTFEEYRLKVIETAKAEYLSQFPMDEVDAFLKREEPYIREMYASDSKPFPDGTQRNPANGIHGTCYGLSMMFE